VIEESMPDPPSILLRASGLCCQSQYAFLQ